MKAGFRVGFGFNIGFVIDLQSLIIDSLLSLLNQSALEPSECLVFPQVSNANQQKQKVFVSSSSGGWRNVLSISRPKSFSPKKAFAKR